MSEGIVLIQSTKIKAKIEVSDTILFLVNISLKNYLLLLKCLTRPPILIIPLLSINHR